jgi:hypothetical protein
MQPQPPISRSLDMLIEKGKSPDHKVIDWQTQSHDQATQLSMIFKPLLRLRTLTFVDGYMAFPQLGRFSQQT